MSKLVLAITGGGTEAIGNLLKVGGASSYFIEAHVPYGMKSLDKFLGFKPEKYCSPETARHMAVESYKRAIAHGAKAEEAVGIGATCSLVKPSGERAGREHLIYVSGFQHNLQFVEGISLKEQ